MVRHCRFVVLFLFFSLLPSAVAIYAGKKYFRFMEEQQQSEALLNLSCHVREVDSQIQFRVPLEQLANRIVQALEKCAGLELEMVERVELTFKLEYPLLFEMLVFDKNYRLISQEKISKKFILEKFARFLFEMSRYDSTEVSLAERRLFREIIGDWCGPESVAYRENDFSTVFWEGKDRDLFWAVLDGGEQTSRTEKNGGIVILIFSPRCYDRYFSPEKVVNGLARGLQDKGIELGFIRKQDLDTFETLLRNDGIEISHLTTGQVTNRAGRNNLFSILPLEGDDGGIIYARKNKRNLDSGRGNYRILLYLLAIIYLLVSGSFLFLENYRYFKPFISARTQLITVFLFSSMLPFLSLYHLSLGTLRFEREMILDSKIEELRRIFYELNEDVLRLKRALWTRLDSLKHLYFEGEEGRSKLKEELEKLRDYGTVADYFVVDESGEVVFKSPRTRMDIFGEFVRNCSSAIIKYRNYGVLTRKDLEKSDSFLTRVVTHLLLDPGTGIFRSILKHSSRLICVNIFEENNYFYVGMLGRPDGTTIGGLVTLAAARDVQKKFLREIFAHRAKQFEDADFKLFAVSRSEGNRKIEIPSKPPAVLMPLVRRIQKENAARHEIIILDGQKKIVYGGVIPELSEFVLVGMLPYQVVLDASRRNFSFIAALFLLNALLVIFMGLVISRRFLAPLARLDDGANQIASGNLSHRIVLDTRDEFERFSETFNKMTSTLEERIFELGELCETARNMLEIRDLKKCSEILLKKAILLASADAGHLVIFEEDSESKELRPSHIIAGGPTKSVSSFPVAFVNAARMLTVTGATRILEQKSIEGWEAIFGEYEGKVVSILAVPVTGKYSAPIGLFLLARKNEVPFDGADMKVMAVLASQAGNAIENARLYEMAVLDGLTGLFVRRYFMGRLDQEIKRARRYRGELSLLIIDIDHFKEINDTFGHQKGDLILIEIASILKSSVRESDLAARYGGEEFAVVLPETGIDGAMIFAERLRKKVEEHEFSGGFASRATISGGVAEFEVGVDINEFINRADMALYISKREGRNRITRFEHSVIQKFRAFESPKII